LLSRLGIAESIKDHLVATKSGDQAGSVARGEAEMIVAVVPSIVSTPGVELAGVFPKELQTYTTFSAAVKAGKDSAQGESSLALIQMLTSPAARVILNAHGMGIGSP
jgi:molybdate transport system substrate-binding protein